MQKLVMLPGPTNVPERVMRAMLKPIINHRSRAFGQLQRSVCDKAREVFQTSNEIVVLTASGTGGVEAAVDNIVRSGDKVVVTSFGEFGGRVAKHVEAAGGAPIVLEAPLGDAPRMDRLKQAFETNGPIKSLIVVYNETSTGVRFAWLDEASRLASKYDAFYIVDAISNLGGDELPVDRLGIDVCVTASQKCLAAPPGLAILSISDRAKKFMISNPPQRLYFNLPRYFKFAETGETPFTPAIPLFYALEEALTIILEEGLSNRIRRHKVCAEAFYAALNAMGLTAMAKEDVKSNTVLAFGYPPNIDDTRFRTTMDERFNVLVARGFGEQRGKVFRIGSMGEVAPSHVLTTVAAVSSTLNMLGYRNSTDSAIDAAASRIEANRA